jgi:integrase
MKTKPKAQTVDAKCVDEDSMRRISYVVPRPGSNRLQFALPTPSDLSHHFPTQWAVRKSLGTSDIPEANRKARIWTAEWELRFEQLRRQDKPQQHTGPATYIDSLPLVTLTPELIAEVTAFHLSRALEGDEAARMAGLSGPEFDNLSFALELEAAKLKQAYARGDTSPVDNMLPQWLAAMGIRVAADDPLYPALAREMVKTRHRTLQARLGRQDGDLVDTPPEPAAPALRALQGATEGVQAATLAPKDKPANALYLRDVLKMWSTKAKPPSLKTIQTATRVVGQFEKVCGNPPLPQITRNHGIDFRDWLLSQEKLSPKTAADRLGYVSRLLQYELDERRRISINPLTRIKVDGSQEPVTERTFVKPKALQALFSLPLFQQYKLHHYKAAGRDASYWIPILGLFTGARITELAQLLVEDIHTTEDGELWCIRILVGEEWQSVKNKPSKRTIPMHPELVRLGLIEYAKAMDRTGHQRLFPMTSVSELNNAGGPFSSWFSKIKTDVGWGPENVFHSFRHNVETVLGDKKMYQRDIDAYMGHLPKGSTGAKVYAHAEPHTLVDVTKAIQYEGLNLPKVFPPEGWTPPPPMAELLRTRPRIKEEASSNTST